MQFVIGFGFSERIIYWCIMSDFILWQDTAAESGICEAQLVIWQA